MAIGDLNDCIARINNVLPPWFGADLTPILTGWINAFAETRSNL